MMKQGLMTRPRLWMLALVASLAFVMLAATVKTAAAADVPEIERSSMSIVRQDSNGGDRPEFYGVVAQMPEGGREGVWVIGTTEVTATATTEFNELAGPLAVGVCAKVRLTGPDSSEADQIERENPSDCDGGHNGGGDDGHGDGISGIVESMPMSGTTGVWVISSKSYTVTEQTVLETEYGAFDIGRCVEVYLAQGATDIARKLETKPAYKCDRADDGSDDDTPPAGVIGKGEVYGELISFPENLIGIWAVGTLTFTTDANTEFKTKNGAFEIGQVVKVEFYIMQDGTFLAREIKTALSDDNDDGDDDHGHHGKNEGHAFGTIELLPEGGLIGVWIVSGVEYSVTERTELNAKNGTFAISETVKIEFKVDDSGMRVAKEIKLKGPQGVPSGEDATVVGFVESMPASGYLGLWVVNGIEFTGTVSSKFKDEHGAFTVGSYVKVEYRLVNGERIIHEMESEVPPGGGDDDFLGEIESMDDSSAMAAATAANSTWTIGGRSFVVTPATRASGSLNTSDTVLVNSYTAADGTQVATLISGVALTDFLYLPSLTR